MADQIVELTGIIFGVGVPLSIPIIWITLNYRRRRRLMELHHAERMAAIERGMDIPPLPLQLIDGALRRRRTSLLPGLVWFFIGLALIVGLSLMWDRDVPWVLGLIPLGVGVAYLIYYGVEGRAVESQERESDRANRRDSTRPRSDQLA